MKQTRNHILHGRQIAKRIATAFVYLVVLAGCAANPLPGGKIKTTPVIEANDAAGAKIIFHQGNFYSLMSPSSTTGCAGDLKTFHLPYSSSSLGATPVSFDANPADPLTTLKPGFIRNVSVDLTDANAAIPSNLAQGCSLGTTGPVPPPSSCATFDYGAISGIPSTLAGSLILMGGTQTVNYASIEPGNSTPSSLSLGCGPMGNSAGSVTLNACAPSQYALGVETLDGSSALTTTGYPNPLTPGLPGTAAQAAPISSWANLSSFTGSGSSTDTPSGKVGASMGLSIDLGELLIFAGASPLNTLDGNAVGSDTADVWTFDLKKQTWKKEQPQVYVAFGTLMMPEILSSPIPGIIYNWRRDIGKRALFQMISVPGMSLNGVTGTGTLHNGVAWQNFSRIDTTERILTVGGYDEFNNVVPVTMKFNPTFGPEFVDRLGTYLPDPYSPIQWLESYPTQLLGNSVASSALGPHPQIDGWINYGAAPILNAPTDATAVRAPIGSIAVAGGFNNYFDNLLVVAPTPSPSPMTLRYLARRDVASISGAVAPAAHAAQFSFVPNDIEGEQVYPGVWESKYMASAVNHPGLYGGVNLLPGFNLVQNDLIYFGGSTCRDYLGDSTPKNPPCDFANPGRYYRLGTIPYQSTETPGAPPEFAFVGTPPMAAGAAAARGLDERGNTIIVAWGGMTDQVTAANPNQIYVLYNAGTLAAPIPTWRTIVAAAPVPNTLTNSSMVFSHVTRKFYLFGGLSISSGTQTLGDTWELSIQGNCVSNSPTCAGFWRKLLPASAGGFMTCYPSCPGVRRSHKLVETNYSYRIGANVHPVTLEPVCTDPNAPCSFGIFMVGGTPDGFSLLDERWIFDPTANNGNGHWQSADRLTARHFSHMATLDYYVANASKRYTRAVTFGGETALQNQGFVRIDDFTTNAVTGVPDPGMAVQNFFVPPTLGDTWMYDMTKDEWQRTKLLGKGYTTAANRALVTDPFEFRQGYDYDMGAPEIAELSAMTPPAISGGVMVTRTQPGPVDAVGTPQNPLDIPEVYLFGGRTKDGLYRRLSEVYKFCIGTTGERQPAWATVDNAQCEAFHATENPSSPGAVTDYVGRWLRKVSPDTALATPTTLDAPYLSAGAYDSVRDRIAIVGGLVDGTNSGGAVTNPAIRSMFGMAPAAVDVWEYTPPSSLVGGTQPDERNGTWAPIAHCDAAPALGLPLGRYGHTLSYDSARRNLVLVGGYDSTGTPLTYTYDYPLQPGRQYDAPEVWTAKFYPDGVYTGAQAVSVNDQTVEFTAPATGCYLWSRKTLFGNSIDLPAQAPPLQGLAHASAVMLPPAGYSTGFYSMFDDSCKKANPVVSSDPEVSKENAGGAYIDIDRTQLGERENLLLNLTFIPLGSSNLRPDGAVLTQKETAVLEIHLVKTAQSQEALQTVQQPRYVRYADQETLFPQIVQRLSVLSPPTGEVRQEQVLIPLSIDPGIDRIRIQRKSGSAILIDATVVRMGTK